jgi:hypothetical protein
MTEEIYDTTHECIYQDLIDDHAFDDETKEEREEIRLFAYRRDLLGCFGINIQDKAASLEDQQHAAQSKMILVFERIKKYDSIQELIEKAKEFVNAEEDLVTFMMLFSYEMLYLMHPIVCELLTTETVREDTKYELIYYLSERENHK